MKAEQKRALALLSHAPGFSRSSLLGMRHLAGDASGRRYFRLFLKGGRAETLILALLSHERGPVTSGGEGLNQDDTFVALSEYFIAKGIDVPRVVLDARKQGALLVEDMGDVALWHFAFGLLNDEGRCIQQRLGAGAAEKLFKGAADVIARIQECGPDDCVAFSRTMGFEEYRVEARRFLDYYLLPGGVEDSRLEIIARAIDAVCESVSSHPRRLMHRDFMAWNIHVRNDGGLAVLDFQDALTGSYAYDIISLLHDRDADFALTDAVCARVLDHFKKARGLGSQFNRHYKECLLQRYLRLAGQFRLLSARTGRPVYENWIPGCLVRIGKTMVSMPDMADALEILCELSEDVRKGALKPWPVLPELTPSSTCRAFWV